MIPQFILAWLPTAKIENPDVRNIVNNHKEKTMPKNYSVDDIHSLSYNEFKKNMERKVREDNLKAIEDEMKRPLFPNTFTDLWKKGMAKNANPEDVREEVDSLPD